MLRGRAAKQFGGAATRRVFQSKPGEIRYGDDCSAGGMRQTLHDWKL